MDLDICRFRDEVENASLNTQQNITYSPEADRRFKSGIERGRVLINILSFIAPYFYYRPLRPTVLPRPSPLTPPKVVLPAHFPRPGTTNDYVPGLSNKRIGEKADDIWGGFRQGNTGNCVTVSAIKVAMTKFGQHPSSIFTDVQKTQQGYKVRMRDGFELVVSHTEISQAVSGAMFIGRDTEMLKDAHFLYAVSAKRAQMENNDGTAWRSFRAAIHSLNNGEDERRPGEALERLGLRNHMKRVSPGDLARGQLGICNRRGHSTAVINGREELWGLMGAPPTHGDAVALM